MRTASGALIALLNNSTQFLLADCVTIVAIDGTITRLTSADHDITVASRYPNLTSPANQTFLSGGALTSSPIFERGTTKLIVGLQADQLTLTIFAKPDTQLYNGIPWPAAATQGAFDGALVVVEKVITGDWSNLSAGTLVLFWGHVGDVTPSRFAVQMNVLSDLDRLTIQQFPPNVYQPPCIHTLFDSGCTLVKASYAIADAAVIGSTNKVINSTLAEADGYFDLGTITFTSGVLAGLSRSIKSYASSTIQLLTPFTLAPAPGDTFNAFPGCDKLQATCSAKFSNLAHFRGYPYVPAPENAG